MIDIRESDPSYTACVEDIALHDFTGPFADEVKRLRREEHLLNQLKLKDANMRVENSQLRRSNSVSNINDTKTDIAFKQSLSPRSRSITYQLSKKTNYFDDPMIVREVHPQL